MRVCVLFHLFGRWYTWCYTPLSAVLDTFGAAYVVGLVDIAAPLPSVEESVMSQVQWVSHNI